MIVVTTNDIPGYRVQAVLGEVMGPTVRSTNQFSEVCAYGTAVIVEAIPAGEPGATGRSAQQAAAR